MFGNIKRHKTLLKGLIALLLICYIFSSVDLTSLASILGKADLSILSFAFLLVILSQFFISNVKWMIILRENGIFIPFKDLCNMYLVGMFFSMFLPGAHGGDLVRAHQVTKFTDKKVEGVMSVILERLTGLLGLLFILWLALMLFKHPLFTASFRMWAVALITAGFAAFFLLFSRGLVRRFAFLSSILGSRLKQSATEIYESIYSLKNKRAAFLITLLSVLFQFMTIIVHYLIAYAVHVDIPFSYLMLVVPLISVLAMLPVTLNGIGVRDMSYIGFFGAIGIEKEFSFSIGLIAFFMVMTVSLMGGIVYLRQK